MNSAFACIASQAEVEGIRRLALRKDYDTQEPGLRRRLLVLTRESPGASRQAERTFNGRAGLPTSSTDGRFPLATSTPGGATP